MSICIIDVLMTERAWSCLIGPLLKLTYHQLSNVERNPRHPPTHPPGGHCWNTYLPWVGSLRFIWFHFAYSKDAAVVVPAVAAVGRIPSSESCIMYSLTVCACSSSSGGPHARVRYDLNGGLPTCIRFYIYQDYMAIVYWCFFVNLIWYLYLFWLNKHSLSLSLYFMGFYEKVSGHWFRTWLVTCWTSSH